MISLKTIKRIVTVVVGGTVLLLVLPGPAFIVIPLGLAILAAEFTWARRWLRKARDLLPNENGGRGFSAFVTRHTKNFLEWASVGPRDTARDTMKGQKDETRKPSQSIVTNCGTSQSERGTTDQANGKSDLGDQRLVARARAQRLDWPPPKRNSDCIHGMRIDD